MVAPVEVGTSALFELPAPEPQRAPDDGNGTSMAG
jgi:hypothetical protein